VDNIFGLPMSSVALVVGVLMGAALGLTALIGLRNRIIFKMALRNIPRRKAQTVLIAAGLMLSTLIVAASLTTGDTLSYSVTKSTYDSLGQVDETIAFAGNPSNKSRVSVDNEPIPASVATELASRLKNDPNIDGVMPVLTIGAPVADTTTRLNEPDVVITGLDPSKLDDFGGLTSSDGTSIDFAKVPADSVVISTDLADSLDAGVGDTLTLYYRNQPHTMTIGAIAQGSILTGYDRESSTGGFGGTGSISPILLGVAMPIDRLQELTGMSGQARFIAVSNTGGVESGAKSSDAASASLRAALAQIDGGNQLGVNTIKHDSLSTAESISSLFTTFYLIMGLFSIASGILLILLIFTMLASERRSEMGMARAVGMTRGQLIQGFITEGTGYALGSALIGAAAGVVVAFGMVQVLGSLVGGTLAITAHVTLRSLFVAYALGVSVTFLTIVFAAVRASRVNIVAAIRDLPDQTHADDDEPIHWNWWSRLPRAGSPIGRVISGIVGLSIEVVWNIALIELKFVVWTMRRVAQKFGWGPSVAIIGIALVTLGVAAKNVYAFASGLSLLTLGLSLFLRRYLPSRPVFTVGAGLMLAYWLLPASVSNRVLPNVGDGGPAMFFISGIFMVLYMTLIIMWNTDLILWVVGLFGRLSSRWLPAVKTAVAYPLASRGRTGKTISMFSIVVFSLVMVKTINVNFLQLLLSNEATAGWDVKVTANSANPIDDLQTRLTGTNVDLANIDAFGKVETISEAKSLIRNPGAPKWSHDTINGMDAMFITDSKIPLQARASGYGSDQAVWQAIASGKPVAVVDTVAFGGGGFGAGSGDAYRAPGSAGTGTEPFQPFDVELRDAQSGETHTVTVIGVIDTKVSTLTGLYLSQATFDSIYNAPDSSLFYLRLSEGSSQDATAMAKNVEASLQSTGVQAISIMDQIEAEDAFSNGFFALLQGFMGLGLLVGIASLGVVSFRSVVERRQQIGMLRAIGYQRSMIAASFLLESIVIATLGIVSGVVLALVLSRNLITGGMIGEQDFTTFVIPWTTIVLVVVAGIAAAGLLTWIPARKASTVPIAEALRYE